MLGKSRVYYLHIVYLKWMMYVRKSDVLDVEYEVCWRRHSLSNLLAFNA